MPYRALLWTVLTVALALLAVGMWMTAVEPMIAGAQAAKPYGEHAAETMQALPPATARATPVQELRTVVKGTLLLSFVLICALLVVGFFASFREWMRYRSGAGRITRKGEKTPYVDAWKIAAERLKQKEVEEEEDDDDEPPEK